MAPIAFTLSLEPAIRTEYGSVCIRFDLGAKAPRRVITATSTDDVIAQLQTFAKEHGKGCAAFATIEPGRRKPAGLDAALKNNRYFNLDNPERALFSS